MRITLSFLTGYAYLPILLPYVLVAPLYFNGTLDIGALQQAGFAFVLSLAFAPHFKVPTGRCLWGLGRWGIVCVQANVGTCTLLCMCTGAVTVNLFQLCSPITTF